MSEAGQRGLLEMAGDLERRAALLRALAEAGSKTQAARKATGRERCTSCGSAHEGLHLLMCARYDAAQ